MLSEVDHLTEQKKTPATSAPQVNSHNVGIMHKIVDLISVLTLGLCQTEGGKMKLDAELKVPLEGFLTSLATNLQFMDAKEAKEHWQGHTAEELNPHGVQSLRSTSTAPYSLQGGQKQNLKKCFMTGQTGMKVAKVVKSPLIQWSQQVLEIALLGYLGVVQAYHDKLIYYIIHVYMYAYVQVLGTLHTMDAEQGTKTTN
ncbi:hypothetical protein EDC04DRAFT_2607558 [Pisolithus marmoratus]|nr:hypothetical protein EDC04DRAFT_2607558 [Pisolithus marmoratus]